MRLLVIALLLASLCAAFTVNPTYRGIKDTGSASLPKLDVDITIDCDTKDLVVQVSSNESGEPVPGARTYLFYTDYTYQALPNPRTTNEEGLAVMPVPGSIRFLTALFILRVDAQSHQSREIEFTYEKCFQAPPSPPPPSPPVNQTNQTPPTNQTAPPPPLGNQTSPGNITNQTTPPITPSSSPQPQIPCLPGLLLIPLAILSRR